MTEHVLNSIPFHFPDSQCQRIPLRVGRCAGQMQAMKGDGLRPVTMHEIMRQVTVLVGDQNWDDLHCWAASVDTGDSVLYLPGRTPTSGKIKIVNQSKTLTEIDYSSSLKPEYVKEWAGSLIHRNSVYTEAQGEEFTQADITRFGNLPQTANDAKQNPFWLALAGGDRALLNAYIDVLDALYGDQEFMRFFIIASSPHATLLERMVCFAGLNAKSNVSAKNLGSLSGAARYVGVPLDPDTYFSDADSSKKASAGTNAQTEKARSGVNQDIKKVA